MENHTLKYFSLNEKSVKPTNLSLREKVSYALGDVGSCLIWNTVSSFLLFFYTDVALIPAQIAGTIIFAARVIDSVIDPAIGAMVDKTRPGRFGKARFYILFGAIPLCIFSVLTFTTFDASLEIKVAWALFTYLILGILYSLVNVPYGSLMATMTIDSNQKVKLASYRNIGMALGSVFLTALTMPLVHYLGKGEQRLGFQLVIGLFSIVAFFCFLSVYKNCQERYVGCSNTSKIKLKNLFSLAFKNKPWIVVIIFSFLNFVRLGVVIGLTIYYCIHVLQQPEKTSILLPLLFVCTFIGSLFAPKFIGRFQHRKGCFIALILSTSGYLLMFAFRDTFVLFLVFYVVSYSSHFLMLTNAMVSDTSSYHEWRFGQHAEGTLYAGYSFVTKVGMACGGALIGIVLAYAGFNHASPVSDETKNSITYLYFFAPVLLNILQFMTIAFYKIDHLMERIVLDITKFNGNRQERKEQERNLLGTLNREEKPI